VASSPGRNDPCPCGSGQKFKHCCGQVGTRVTSGPPPESPEVAALLALINRGRTTEAEQRAAALLTARPQAGSLWKILGVALLRQGKDALAPLTRAAELLPQDAEAHTNLGAVLGQRGQWEAALVSLRRSLALESRNPTALILAANAQRVLGRAREAVTLYQWALQLEPRRYEVHNDLGNAFLDLAQPAEAVRCYRGALELKPDDPQVLCNLGNALRQLGQLQEAFACTRRALALAPGLSMAHNNLGLLYAASGERAQALGCYREALRLNPGYVDALNNLGAALQAQGERREALALYGQAVELEPRRADSHCNLGYALLDSRRSAEALASFRNALAAQPGSVPAHLGLAAAQRVQGQFEQAEASARAALALAPHSPEVLALLGELRADRGQFGEAQELFERALAADPQFASAYGSIAAHRRMTREDAAWLKGAEELLGRQLPLDQEIHLRYALGKYFDDTGQYEEAFSNYQQANELSKRQGARYDRTRLTQLVDRLIAFCDARFVRQERPGACDSALPVLIIGMPRSGTSLAEQILASHPAVFGAGEVRFWDRAFANLEQLGRDGAAAAQALGRVGRDYLAQVSAPAGAAVRVTDKMPANFLYAGLIHAALPRARIIHMQRHPLDTCLSVYFQNFFNVSPYANDLGDLAHYYGEYRRISTHWRRVLPAQSLLEVPYEELIADQEGWTRRLLDFVGLPWDPRCLEFHRTERVVITASKWQVRQKLHSASAGRWRHYERHLGPLLPLASAPES